MIDGAFVESMLAVGRGCSDHCDCRPAVRRVVVGWAEQRREGISNK